MPESMVMSDCLAWTWLLRHNSFFCLGLSNKRAQLAHFLVLSGRERKPVPVAQCDQAPVIIQCLLRDPDLESSVPKRILYQSGLVFADHPSMKTAPNGNCLYCFRDIALSWAFCLGFFRHDLLFWRQNSLWVDVEHHVCLIVKIFANAIVTITDYGYFLSFELFFWLTQISYWINLGHPLTCEVLPDELWRSGARSMIGRREVRGGVLTIYHGKVILPIGKDIEGLLELIFVQLERHN